MQQYNYQQILNIY